MCGDCGRRKSSELSTQSLILIVGGCNKCTSCQGKKPNVSKTDWAAIVLCFVMGQFLRPQMALEGDKRGSRLANVSQSLVTSCF
jgi:hypothetical protein